MSVGQPTHPKDLAFVARIRDGDEDAAREFAQIYARRFEFLARRKGVRHQDCQDVAQNALMDAFSQMKRGLYRGESSLSTWLSRIIHGKIVEYRRKNPNGIIEQLDDSNLEGHSTLLRMGEVATTEVLLMVRQALLRMPSQHRVILLLNRAEGYTLEEISKMADMSLGQVSGKLYVAQEMFRRCLNEGTISTGKRRFTAITAADAHRQGATYARSIINQTDAGLSVAGNQSIVDSLLFRTRQRIGKTIDRSAFAGMRNLLARGAAIGCRGAGAGHRSQPSANTLA
ncbi:MAG: RNA polymerase sigma factor [Blastocatellales bacterium]